MDFPTEKNPIPDVTLLVCDTCGKITAPTGKPDDCGVQFYKCPDGHFTSKPHKKNYSAAGRDVDLPKETLAMQAKYGIGSHYSRDETEQFNPNVFANSLMGQFFFRTDKQTQIIYVYNVESGIWEPDGETFVHQALVERLGLEVKPHYKEGVKFYLMGSTFEKVTETPSLIALENGVLNVETLVLLEKSPGYFILSQLPVKYDVAAKCPLILKFLREVFGEQQLTALQEALGYTLHKAPLFEKAFMLIGDGANGKSTFLNLLQTFLGPGNFSSCTLQSLCTNRFATANLYGKLANISADLPKTAIASTGIFKMLTGKDMITAEFKTKPAFQFINTAKTWFSCNEFPQTSEDTLAYVRRWKIFNCGSTFLGEKADPKILDKLTTETELSGFLNWILEGLKRLLDNGRFSVNETEETLRENILKLSNPTKAFIEKELEASNDVKDFIEQDLLYADFVRFCDSENLPAVRKAQFTQTLQQEIPDVKTTKQRLGLEKKPTAVYQFVRKKSVVPFVPTTLTALFPETEIKEMDKSLGTTGTEQADKPTFYVRETAASEKCDCGNFAVTKEILIPSGDTIRRCEGCFKQLQESFSDAVFKAGSPCMADFDDKAEGF